MHTTIKEMEIADYSILQNLKAAIYRLWKKKIIIILVTILCVAVSGIFLTLKDEETSFYSTATIYSAVYGSYSETVSGVTIMNTYAGILGSSRVCERAAAEIGDSSINASYLKSMVSSGKITLSGASTESKSYGYRLVLTTRLDNPTNVVEITNAMANAFTGEINELMGGDVVQVFDQAVTSFMQRGTSNYIIVLIFAIVGFLLSTGVIFIKEFFSYRVYIVSQCIYDKELLLGIIPFGKR